jgi:hypothetical protein
MGQCAAVMARPLLGVAHTRISWMKAVRFASQVSQIASFLSTSILTQKANLACKKILPGAAERDFSVWEIQADGNPGGQAPRSYDC